MTNQTKLLSSPLVSVIVLNYNGKQFVDRCMRSLLNTCYPNFEIVLFDNNSKDGSLEFLEETFGADPRIKVIKSKVNLGFALGNNVAVNSARGQYLVFLNCDTEVDSNWLRELVSIIEFDPKIGAAQSKLLQMDRRHFDSAGDLLYTCGIAFSRGAGEADHGQYEQVEEIFSARGAAVIIRSQVFRNVGMFDPTFVLQLEDLDLCWRIRLHGYKIVFVPKSVVYHKGSASLRKVPREESGFMSQRNRLLMALKNYSLANLIKYFPTILMLTFFGFVFEKNSVQCRIKALFWILSNFGNVWMERLTVQNCVRAVSDSQILKYMLKTEPVLNANNLKRSMKN
jgi:GT2 family glycosyltransferase